MADVTRQQVIDQTEHPEENTNNRITVYGRPGCPGVGPVLRFLNSAGMAYNYVDIRRDPEAAARVRALAHGHESVPTVVLPDGRALVEPGVFGLRQALQDAGETGPALDGPAAAVRAGLSNPVYLILLLIAAALVVAVLVAG